LTNAIRALAATYQPNSSWPVKPPMTLITVIRANGVWLDICMDNLNASIPSAKVKISRVGVGNAAEVWAKFNTY